MGHAWAFSPLTNRLTTLARPDQAADLSGLVLTATLVGTSTGVAAFVGVYLSLAPRGSAHAPGRDHRRAGGRARADRRVRRLRAVLASEPLASTLEGGMTTTPAQDPDLLAAARAGDEQPTSGWSSRIAASCTPTATGCSGSTHDAEDALQETLLRAWRGLARFEGRSSLRSWLYKIATNTSLNAVEKRPKRVLPIDYGPASDPHGGPGEPLVESVWIEPYPGRAPGSRTAWPRPEARYEQREAIELAFIAACSTCRQPARRAHPARGARLLGPGGRRHARHHHGLGQQRAATGA